MTRAHSYPPYRRIQGFSLVEVLIGLVLTTFLLLGMVEMFSASQAAYRASTGISRNQENSRFAIDLLSRDLRMTGNMGCAGDTSHLPVLIDGALVSNGQEFFSHFESAPPTAWAAPRYALRFDVSIQGYEATPTIGGVTFSTAPGGAFTLPATPGAGASTDWLPNVNTGLFGALTPVPIQGSDILVLRFFGADGVPITGTNLSSTATSTMAVGTTDDADKIRTAASTPALPNYGFYGVANCTIASVFSVTGNPSGLNNDFQIANGLANNLRYFSGMEATYQPNATNIYPAFVMAYYVGVRTGSTIPSLYRARFNGTTWVTEELVEGVEMMQLTYGRDWDNPAVTTDGALDGGVEDFVTADTVFATDPTGNSINCGAGTTPASNYTCSNGAGTWLRVNAVRLSLLLRSPQSTSTSNVAAGTIQVGGVAVTPPAARAVLRTPYDVTVSLRNRTSGTY